VSQQDGFLRVLIEPKEKQALVWIATCLETGYVASANSCEAARDEMLSVLREEYVYARRHNNLRAFFRSTAVPQELLDRWKDAISDEPAKRIPLFPEESQPSQPVDLATIPRAA